MGIFGWRWKKGMFIWIWIPIEEKIEFYNNNKGFEKDRIYSVWSFLSEKLFQFQILPFQYYLSLLFHSRYSLISSSGYNNRPNYETNFNFQYTYFQVEVRNYL